MVESNLICSSLPSMLLLLTHLFLCSGNQLSNVQMTALIDLKAGITSDPTGCLSGLREDENPCSSNISPARIVCDNSKTKVLNLDLRSCSLSGTLSRSIGKLVDLQSLHLDSNNFTGPIPNVFSNMASLSNISMTYDGFNGSIPSTFAHLKSLRFLFLNGNKLTGDVPLSLLELPHLESLTLFSNYLNKKRLPTWVAFDFQS